MLKSMTAMERRIFHLLGDGDVGPARLRAIIMEEFGVSEDEAVDAAKTVLRKYGTPNLAIAREALARLDEIIPYI